MQEKLENIFILSPGMSSFFLAQEVGQVIRAASDCSVHRVGSFRLLPGIPLVSQHRLLAHYYAGVSGLCSLLAPLSSSFPQESLEAKFLEPNKNGLLRVYSALHCTIYWVYWLVSVCRVFGMESAVNHS